MSAETATAKAKSEERAIEVRMMTSIAESDLIDVLCGKVDGRGCQKGVL